MLPSIFSYYKQRCSRYCACTVHALEEPAGLELGMGIPLLYFAVDEITTVVFNDDSDRKHPFTEPFPCQAQ